MLQVSSRDEPATRLKFNYYYPYTKPPSQPIHSHTHLSRKPEASEEVFSHEHASSLDHELQRLPHMDSTNTNTLPHIEPLATKPTTHVASRHNSSDMTIPASTQVLPPDHALSPHLSPETTTLLRVGRSTLPIHTLLLSQTPYFAGLLPTTKATLPAPVNRTTPSGLSVRVNLPPLPPRVITLPDEWCVSQEDLESWIEWCYFGQSIWHGSLGYDLPRRPHLSMGVAMDGAMDAEKVDAETAIRLWVFAARLGDTNCMDWCVGLIERCRRVSGVVCTGLIRWVWGVTSKYMDENDEEDGDNEAGGGAGEGESITEVESVESKCGGNGEVKKRGSVRNFNDLWEERWMGRYCPLRRLLVDHCAWMLHKEWLMTHKEQFPKEFLLDLAYRLREMSTENMKAPFGEGMEAYSVTDIKI